MLKLYCDFNGQDLKRYFLLRVPDDTDGLWPELEVRAKDLGIKAGDRVILFQDVGDFEVEATLGFGSSDTFSATRWYAVPDWNTLRYFDQAGQ